MPKLTRSRIAQIVEVLDNSLFTSSAFELLDPQNSNDIITIRYRDDSRYFAKFYKAPKSAKSLHEKVALMHAPEPVTCASFSPGDYMEAEVHEDKNFSYFVAQLQHWTERLRSEIVLIGVFQKQFEDFQTSLQAKLEESFPDPEAQFSQDERDLLREQLAVFERRLSELEDDKELTESELNKLRSTIDDLSRAAVNLPKRAWYRTACSKLYTITTKVLSSKSGQKAIESTIDNLLDGSK